MLQSMGLWELEGETDQGGSEDNLPLFPSISMGKELAVSSAFH